MYDRVVELLRHNQEEALNAEKFYVRTKRKFVAYSVPGKMKKSHKYSMDELLKSLDERDRITLDEKTNVKSFE